MLVVAKHDPTSGQMDAGTIARDLVGAGMDSKFAKKTAKQIKDGECRVQGPHEVGIRMAITLMSIPYLLVETNPPLLQPNADCVPKPFLSGMDAASHEAMADDLTNFSAMFNKTTPAKNVATSSRASSASSSSGDAALGLELEESGGGGAPCLGGDGDNGNAAATPVDRTCLRELGQPSSEVDSQFYYVDTQGVEQGPFGLIQMKMWSMKGLLPDTLMIKQGNGATLRPLSVWKSTFDECSGNTVCDTEDETAAATSNLPTRVTFADSRYGQPMERGETDTSRSAYVENPVANKNTLAQRFISNPDGNERDPDVDDTYTDTSQTLNHTHGRERTFVWPCGINRWIACDI